MLELKDVSKKFGEVTAVDRVSVGLPKKQVIGLLGPNGAGKTTLMRMIVGFLKPTSGKVLWKGRATEDWGEGYKRKIGYLPENNPLYLNMTVGEYLLMTATLKGVTKDKLLKEARGKAKECQVLDMWQRKIETLSKGYRQRVGLAAAIIGNPSLVILDEPTSGLDPRQIVEIRELIKELAKTNIILLSTHNLPEAKEVCSRILIISQGKIVLDDEMKKVRHLEKKFIELTS